SRRHRLQILTTRYNFLPLLFIAGRILSSMMSFNGAAPMRIAFFARSFVLCLSLFFLASCGSDDKPPKADFGIAPDGLSGRIILRLYEGDGKIFAATDRGLFTRNKGDRKSTRLNSSHVKISYAVFCLKKKKKS